MTTGSRTTSTNASMPCAMLTISGNWKGPGSKITSSGPRRCRLAARHQKAVEDAGGRLPQMRPNGGGGNIESYLKKQRSNAHLQMKASERDNEADLNDQKPEICWRDCETSSKTSCASWRWNTSLYQQSGRERSAHDQGATESFRLFPVHGRGEDLLSSSQLPVNLPKAGNDGNSSIDIAFSRKES